jgi:hypothetical protein
MATAHTIQVRIPSPISDVLTRDLQWDETNYSSSFPGLETLYKLWLVDVKIPGLERGVTGQTFQSIENPDLTTGKVHTWVWKQFGSVEKAKELATMLKARYPPKPVTPSLTPGSE